MIEITNYKQIGKGSLLGTFSLKVPKWGNFNIREMALFQKGHNRWISFPSKQYEHEGEKKYFMYNCFDDDKTLKLFQSEVLKALDDYFLRNNAN